MSFYVNNASPTIFMGQHIPVLLQEVIEALAPSSEKHFLDCTFGGGGHTRALLSGHQEVHVDALDCDPSARQRAETLQREFPHKLRFFSLNFSEIDELPEGQYDGVLMDLGISSYHVDEAERGFSLRQSGPLDMRMDTRRGQTAAEFINQASRQELIQAVRNLGEEKHWRRVVDLLESSRRTELLNDTTLLAEAIAGVIPQRPGRRARIHPATKTFQGLRMMVNQELEHIEIALPKAFDRLKSGGVLAVISFHSGEDRIIKKFMRFLSGQPLHRGDSTPQQLRKKFATSLTRKPVEPGPRETAENPRSRSAKLRLLRKD